MLSHASPELIPLLAGSMLAYVSALVWLQLSELSSYKDKEGEIMSWYQRKEDLKVNAQLYLSAVQHLCDIGHVLPVSQWNMWQKINIKLLYNCDLYTWLVLQQYCLKRLTHGERLVCHGIAIYLMCFHLRMTSVFSYPVLTNYISWKEKTYSHTQLKKKLMIDSSYTSCHKIKIRWLILSKFKCAFSSFSLLTHF